ncbi:MAG: O-methyltransferase family 3 [Bacteroidota bacterium]|jgi:predicted O-methyltransferase YrrM|nr:O-methyltransferase family 3 [Bacteroidota bacterium]
MDFISKDLSDYCERYTSSESEVLTRLNRETHLKVVSPRMLSGHLQGRFLSFISKLQQPKLIVEIGTYTGYSALCLAEGLAKDGKLISIDVNEETSAFAKSFIEKTESANQIELVLADAKNYIPTIKEPIDLVFIDADKKNYLNYYHLVIDKLNPGGLIIADNVLWSGKITLSENEMDKETLALHHFNQFVQKDNRVENLLLPIRDGLMVVRKN